MMELVFAPTVADPRSYLPHQALGGDAVEPAGDGGLAGVLAYIEQAGFMFEPWQVASFIAALRTKPFLILAGISGTGKTRLPLLVAEATGAEAIVVPVRPDWTDSSDLLGYERLDHSFVPGHLLALCERALRAPDTQFFFILDEMNVARVEYYFAEVLSVMESRRRADGSFVTDPLYRSAPTTMVDDRSVAWGGVYLPANVSIIGTVNMDETTHGFSRKVLDRAFVLELSDVDLSEYPATEAAPVPRAEWSASEWLPTYLRLSEIPNPAGQPVVVEAVNSLTRANESLSEAQLQVGFRVRDEVIMFCLNARPALEHFVDRDQTVVAPLDLCLSMKILPRIQGGGTLLKTVLEDIDSWASPAPADTTTSESPAGFPRTSARVRLMQRRLEQTGFTSYWV